MYDSFYKTKLFRIELNPYDFVKFKKIPSLYD